MKILERIERNDLIRDGEFFTAAGPCAIESAEQIYEMALVLSQIEKVRVLRAMYRKPRTNPGSFQGIGISILPTLSEIKRRTGLVIVSEVMDKDDLGQTTGIVDVNQIGSRNMQNYSLLAACKDDGRPVILKRGLIATVSEWMGAAEYIGTDKVILCERGVRAGSEDKDIRFTLDLGGAVVAKTEYGIPVIGDPSHAAGKSSLVPALARSIAAAGLDGMIIEVHQNPETALCDAKQQITPATFREVLGQVNAIHRLTNSYLERVSVK